MLDGDVSESKFGVEGSEEMEKKRLLRSNN